jgi:hypothetical protein
MSRATPALVVFARTLIAFDIEESRYLKTRGASFATVDKLRQRLEIFLGKAGFRAILTRALVLASTEANWLRAVHIRGDGSLEGLEDLATEVAPDEFLTGRVLVLAHLLGMLVSFIGEELTRQTLQDIWPTLSLKDLRLGVTDEKAK